jgi:hypothetical protein
MAKWLEINSTNLLHFCGEDVGHTLANALNGIAAWWHTEDAPHEFELDLGSNFIITKVRGRSDAGEYDPRDISIYVSQDRSDYGAAVANVTTWYDTIVWVEISTTTKIGRYVKVVIETTENRSRYLRFGAYELEPAFAIFDVCRRIRLYLLQILFICTMGRIIPLRRHQQMTMRPEYH